jgi:LacI family transcriptional regulator
MAGMNINAVARRARVSTATVSRVINDPAQVSEPLRTRIQSSIAHLGWAPHAAARALATQRTATVGAIIPTLANEHFATAIQALQEELEARDYTLLLACSEYEQTREARQLAKMLERGVDAVALVGEAHAPEVYDLLRRRETPFVNTFTWREGASSPCIGADNYAAFHELTTHLFDLGHRRFGMLAQNADTNDRAMARLNGVRDALAEHGVAMRPDHVAQGFWGVVEGRRLFREVMARPNRPTALICGNGSLSLGAMLEASALGIRVPEELTIFGFDDFEMMAELPVAISTVRVPSWEIGRRTAAYLVDCLQGVKPAAPCALRSELVLRASSGPPPSDNT